MAIDMAVNPINSEVDKQVERAITALAEAGCDQGFFSHTFSFCEYWLDDKPSYSLTACYFVSNINALTELHFCVALTADIAGAVSSLVSLGDLQRLCQQMGLPIFSDRNPIPLQPLSIKKPWGQEIWYTGIEERGVAQAGNDNHWSLLPWVLAAAPDRLTRLRHRQLILLKILDPLAEVVRGDLYFELHQEKREVYVVTAVDEKAWPEGIGGIRFGFDPDVVAQYPDELSFKQSYLQAVKEYELVRRKLDTLSEQGTEDFSAELLEHESLLRSNIEAYSLVKPLSVGDVVQVPCFTPHSLLHGVRTVEFQTPVYERLILSFAQKVLTQSHWDTEQAVDKMNVAQPLEPGFEILKKADGVLIERIVDFEDFEVRRIRLSSGACLKLSLEADYGLLMPVSGCLDLSGLMVKAEQAVLLPSAWIGCHMSNSGEFELCFLLAYPK